MIVNQFSSYTSEAITNRSKFLSIVNVYSSLLENTSIRSSVKEDITMIRSCMYMMSQHDLQVIMQHEGFHVLLMDIWRLSLGKEPSSM